MSSFTNATGFVNVMSQEGAMAQYTTARPTSTIFRYRSIQHPVFAQGWYHENFDKGKSAYLGEVLRYTASRNKDCQCDTLIQYDFPGLLNAQYHGPHAGTADRMIEVLHPDLCLNYNDVAVVSSGVATGVHCIDERLCKLMAGSGANGAIRKGHGQPHWTDGVALAAIKYVDFSLGGQRLDRQDAQAMYSWHLLNNVNVPFKMLGLAQDRGNNDLELKRDSMTFQRKYAPLCFTFCRHPSMSIPLISNIYNNLVIECELQAPSALVKNYSGAGNSAGATSNYVSVHTTLTSDDALLGPTALSATGLTIQAKSGMLPMTKDVTNFYTCVRGNENTIEASRSRGRNIACAQKSGLGAAALTSSTLTASQCPVAIVSRVFFLGPQERYAFASNSHCQVVEACQRLKASVTNVPSYTFRTDQLQNSCSALYVCPIYRRQLSCNEYFNYGGAHDAVRGGSLPAISTIQMTSGGAELFHTADESFYGQVQPYIHTKNVVPNGRRSYGMHFGAKQNGVGPVQFLGGVNLSRTPNSAVTIGFQSNCWTKGTGETEVAGVQLAAHTSTIMEVELVVWNYNVLCYRGGVGGYKFTQSNNSL